VDWFSERCCSDLPGFGRQRWQRRRRTGCWRRWRLLTAARAGRANLPFEELAALDPEADASIEIHTQPVLRQDLRDEVVEGVGTERRGRVEHLQSKLRFLRRQRAFDAQQIGCDRSLRCDLQI